MLYTQLSAPSSSGVQEIKVEEANTKENSSESSSPDKNGAPQRKNSIDQQQDSVTNTTETAKTPSIKRRQQSQQDGITVR